MRLGIFSCSIFALATFALGCDEPIPPTPQGAFLVNFQQTPGTCPQKSHQSIMGDITTTERKTIAVDNVARASIECSVVGGDLGPFEISARMSFEGTENLSVSVKSIDSKATSASPAIGSVSFASSETAGNTYGVTSDQPCEFYITPGGGEGVKPGAAWLSFKCPQIVQSMNTCALAESVILMENCTQ